MGRVFTKNTANLLQLGIGALNPLISGSAHISATAWVKVTSATAAVNNANRIFSIIIAGVNTGFTLEVDNQTASILPKVGGRSVTGDTFQTATGTTNIPINTWVHVGGMADFTGKKITIYYNGVAEATTSSAAFTQNTYTVGASTRADSIGDAGSGVDTNTQFDGSIAEIALWKSDIGDASFVRLAQGENPLKVSPNTLVLYMPLYGDTSPEKDIISNKTGTITGSLPQISHANLVRPLSTGSLGVS